LAQLTRRSHADVLDFSSGQPSLERLEYRPDVGFGARVTCTLTPERTVDEGDNRACGRRSRGTPSQPRQGRGGVQPRRSSLERKQPDPPASPETRGATVTDATELRDLRRDATNQPPAGHNADLERALPLDQGLQRRDRAKDTEYDLLLVQIELGKPPE
jgi:hypothetical protein